MRKQGFMLWMMLVCLAGLAACSPGTAIQINTPAPGTASGTPAPGGVIDVPGVKLQLYAPGPNPMVGTPDAHGRPASFWLGVWHGVISPFTLLASFLGPQTVPMYEVHNDGKLYNLGFFVGVLVMPGVLGIFFGWRR